MIYQLIMELDADPNTVVLFDIFKNLNSFRVSLHAIHSKSDKLIFLPANGRRAKKIKRVKDKLSKVLNWQLLENKNYLIMWTNDLSVIVNKYMQIEELLGRSMKDFHTLRYFEHIEDSKYELSVKTIEELFKGK